MDARAIYEGDNVRVTKYVITSPECTDILPSDVSSMVYDSKHSVNVKETCFGAIIDGEEDGIKLLIEEIRALDPPGIFIKDRGFPPGDPRRCRGPTCGSPNKIVSLAFGRRAGGARTGYCMIEAESRMLPMISRALAFQAKGETDAPEKAAATKRPLDKMKLEEIIKDELPLGSWLKWTDCH
ncbi:MAG: DUF2102 domain-containing protein [Methanothrix sp.]|nr:MAG: DUF2102 domain-containing protein [Methanothrix sp.]